MIAITALGLATQVFAAEKTVSPEIAKAANNYKKCATCHGFQGEKKALGKSGVISEMDETTINTALVNYKKGTMNKFGMGALMKSQTAGLSEEDMEHLAKYIASFKVQKK